MASRYRLACAVALVAALAACGGGGGGQLATSGSATTTTALLTTTPATTPVPALQLEITTTPWRLPAPTSRAVLLDDGPTLVLLGGQDARHVSIAAAYTIDPATGTATSIGTLDPAVHDAAGARVNAQNVVIAGGTPPARATVQVIGAGQPTRTIGQLPAPRTDHVAALVSGTVYVLGGADPGGSPLASIVASDDGASWRDAGTLSEAVRYPAAAAVGDAVYLFGGVGTGSAGTTAIQRFDPRAQTTRVVAQLPAPLSHAVAVVLGGVIWVLGGFVSDVPSTQVLRFDPATNQVTSAGTLPAAITDAAGVATSTTTAYVVGGEGPGRSTTAAVLLLTAS